MSNQKETGSYAILLSSGNYYKWNTAGGVEKLENADIDHDLKHVVHVFDNLFKKQKFKEIINVSAANLGATDLDLINDIRKQKALDKLDANEKKALGLVESETAPKGC